MAESTYETLFLQQISVPSKLITSYKSLGLSELEFVVILQIYQFLQNNNDFPTPKEIATNLTINERDCTDILRSLIQKQLLEIKKSKNEHQQLTEAYSLELLWQKLFTEQKPVDENSEGKLFMMFEQEFARPLSPFEIEMICVWLDEDKIKFELIQAALREAVLMGRLNFKYIDGILREWKRKNITTVEHARQSGQAFRQHQVQKQYKTEKKRDDSIYYNWLEE